MQQQFVGLTMPVFSAFGWAGEETALKYALTQLEEFINRVHMSLPRELQTYFPFYGLDRASQSAFLASSAQTEAAPYFAFFVRPLSLEMQYSIKDKMALSTAWKACESNPERWLELMQGLGPGWSLRIQQMEWDEDTGAATFYQDLFKDDLAALDLETAVHTTARASFLNAEPKWLVQLTLSFRVPSEQVAMLGVNVIDQAIDWLRAFMPVHETLVKREPGAAKKKPKPKIELPKEETEEAPRPEPLEQFTYISRLKPLHIRRGFVNLTPEHWPFFASNARATSREVTLSYEDYHDRAASVWRLAPNDQARIVLTPRAQGWLEDNFEANDRIQVTASKLEDDVIEVKLEAVE